MSVKSANLNSDLGKVDAHVVRDEEHEELPALTEAALQRPDAIWSLGQRVISAAAGQTAFAAAMKRQKISITLDPDVLSGFKQQAGPRAYQTLINATLREAMQRKTIGETLRKVIREELHPQ